MRSVTVALHSDASIQVASNTMTLNNNATILMQTV